MTVTIMLVLGMFFIPLTLTWIYNELEYRRMVRQAEALRKQFELAQLHDEWARAEWDRTE